MAKTDTSERGLETLIMRHMTGVDGLSLTPDAVLKESAPSVGGNGWFAGSPESYDREFASAITATGET
jgi:type I restriction enzyme, R subunit